MRSYNVKLHCKGHGYVEEKIIETSFAIRLLHRPSVSGREYVKVKDFIYKQLHNDVCFAGVHFLSVLGLNMGSLIHAVEMVAYRLCVCVYVRKCCPGSIQPCAMTNRDMY